MKFKLYTFNEYINEAKKDLTKIQFVKLKDTVTTVTNTKLLGLNHYALHEYYIPVIRDILGSENYNNYKFDKKSPILYYANMSDDGIKILKNNYNKNLSYSKIYNSPDKRMIEVSSKVKFHKLLAKADYVPKTVFTINDTNNLKFPIVAKPDSGQSGVGIEVFKTFKDLQKSKNKFDLFSEFVDFDREFRALFLKDKLVTLNERIPIISDNKTISTKSTDEKVKFTYIEQDVEKSKYVKELMNMRSDVFTMIDADAFDFYSFDFFLKKDGTLSLIEINTGSGLGANNLAKTYEAIYLDFYKKSVSVETKANIELISKEYSDILKEDYTKEYNKSLAPKY
jgi:glutathione synthase/RimK-type ligase-like ATP-grasp enzyme